MTAPGPAQPAGNGEIVQITATYTGTPIDWADLSAAHKEGGVARQLASAIANAATEIAVAENELTALADSTSTTLAALTAAHPVTADWGFNDLRDLASRGPRLGMLASIRRERIRHLQTLAGLWRTQRDQTPDAGPPDAGTAPAG